MKPIDLKFFTWEEKGGQVKKQQKSFLFLLPLHQAITNLHLYFYKLLLRSTFAKNGFVQGQLPSVTLSYISASSTLRQDST